MLPSAIKRLAADLTSLHESLPPNYLFSPDDETQDDLSSLDILLVGPSHTPFCNGVWRLHFDIPTDYPQRPPTANFRTPIFHPNVDSQTGSICVETLKRDWSSSLTLRHLLITISCLLVQPNPDSALNAEAGALIQEGYEQFAKRARLLTSIHANVPSSLLEAAREAQRRGEDQPVSNNGSTRFASSFDRQPISKRVGQRSSDLPDGHIPCNGEVLELSDSLQGQRASKREGQGTIHSQVNDSTTSELQGRTAAPKRSRICTDPGRRQHPDNVSRISSGEGQDWSVRCTQEEHEATTQYITAQQEQISPDLVPARRRRPAVRSRLHARRSNSSPIAHLTRRRRTESTLIPNTVMNGDEDLGHDSDGSIEDSIQDNQENGQVQKQSVNQPAGSTPKRPPGPPIPLGELVLDDSSSDLMEIEYPPSPKKSPVKHTERIRRLEWSSFDYSTLPDSIQTPAILSDQHTSAPTPLAFGKGKERCYATPDALFLSGGPRDLALEQTELLTATQQSSETGYPLKDETFSDEKLWQLCGGDVKRWNRGDFGGRLFPTIAARW